jgi:hypothetical protein
MMAQVGLAVLLIVVLGIFGAWCLMHYFSVFNSDDGERYQRRRMQGPFVPLSHEDIEEDERRKRRRS